MKKLFVLSLLAFALCACGGNSVVVDPSVPVVVATPSTMDQAQDAATKTVLSVGDVIYSGKIIIKAARQSGTIKTKEAYNAAVDVYNRALASYTLLNQTLQAAIKAGKDPASVTSYLDAMKTFTEDRNALNNLLTTIGGK